MVKEKRPHNKRTHEQFVSEMARKFSSIEILSKYETRDSSISFRCTKCGTEDTRQAKRLLVWSGCPVCNHGSGRRSWVHDDFVRMVHDLAGEEFEVVGKYVSNTAPVKIYHSVCKGYFDTKLASGLSKHICPYCSNREVLVGYNDLWTTNTKKASMLKDEFLGCEMTGSEETHVEVLCPHCGRTIVKAMNRFSDVYCPCPFCSDTTPFAERFLAAVLNQLGVYYKHDSRTEWSENKRYDFIIGNNIICETHGQQHYEDRMQFHKEVNPEEIKANDIYKRNLALANGIVHYIELDCRRSESNYVKNSILNSELVDLFDFSGFDWRMCEEDCFSRGDMEYIALYKEGYSAPQIADILDVSHSKAWRVLKKAAKNGLCDYNPIAAREATQFKTKNKDIRGAG